MSATGCSCDQIKLHYDVWFAGDHYAIVFLEEDGRVGEVGVED